MARPSHHCHAKYLLCVENQLVCMHFFQTPLYAGQGSILRTRKVFVISFLLYCALRLGCHPDSWEVLPDCLLNLPVELEKSVTRPVRSLLVTLHYTNPGSRNHRVESMAYI